MKTNKMLMGLTGVATFALLGMGSVAWAAPGGGNPLNDVADLLRGILRVEVVNSEPLLVSPVVSAEEPLTLTLGTGDESYEVPEGKLLVIQAVSFDVNTDAYPDIPHPPSGTISVAEFGSDPDFKFFFFAIDKLVAHGPKWVTHEQTTIYATAGKTVTGSITPFAGYNGRVTVSAVLRDAP